MQVVEKTIEYICCSVLMAVAMLIFSTSANAFVGQECPTISEAARNLNDLIKVGYIGSNKPLCLDEFNRLHPEAAQMANWVSRVTLPFACDGEMGNAVYVKTKSRRILVSVSHIQIPTVKVSGRYVVKRISPIKNCVLLNKGVPVPLDTQVEPIAGVSREHPTPYAGKDFLVFAVEKPLEGVPMIPIAEPGRTAVGDTLFQISALPLSDPDFGQNCKTALRCSDLNVLPYAGMATTYKTDCSATKGMSGSALVGKAPDGRVELRALAAGATEKNTGSPYSDRDNFVEDVAVDGPFREAIDLMDRQLTGEPTQEASVNLNANSARPGR